MNTYNRANRAQVNGIKNLHKNEQAEKFLVHIRKKKWQMFIIRSTVLIFDQGDKHGIPEFRIQ